MRRTGCSLIRRMRPMASSTVVLVLIGLILSVRAAVVTVDFQTTLSTNGEQVFDRHRFVNAHGSLASTLNAREMMEYIVLDLDVRLTRSASEGPFTGSEGFPDDVDGLEEEGALRLNQITCSTCDPLRKRLLNGERIATDKSDQLLRFQHSDELISEAAVFSGQYFSRFFNAEEGFPKPRYSECFNEPLGEYAMFRRYPEESEYSVVSRIGNICGQMCREIKAANPNMLAGGPGENNGRPHIGNFSQWQTRIKNFIDSARSAGCVDFISQHPYSSGGAVQDANLDLLESYTMKTSDDGKPIKYMVTETGAYHGSWHSKVTKESRPPTGGRNFIIMADAFKAFMSTIRVHDNLLKFVNFLTLAPNDSRNGLTHPYPWSLTIGGADDVLEWTDLLLYLELFKGVEGDFVYSYSDDPYVTVLSVANSNRAYILLQNLATEGVAAQIDLNLPFAAGEVESVVERKLWLEEGEPTADDIAQSIQRPGTVRWSNSTLSSVPESVQVEPEAMHVLAITFTTPLREVYKVERSRHYMGEILDSTGQAQDFPVAIDANEIYAFQFSDIPQSPNGVGYIRISHSRKLNDDAKPKVWINDAEEPIADYDERMAGPKRNYDSRYFGTFVIPYRLADLGSSPEIKVQYSDDGGWLSSVVLEVDECVGGACCLLGGGTNSNLPCGTITNPEDYPQRSSPNAEQLLKDPSFEEQDGAWSLLDGAEIQSSSFSREGDHRLKLGAEGAKAVQRVYLRNNNVYRLHCYVRGSIRFSIADDSTMFGDSLGNSFPGQNGLWRNQEFDFRIQDSGEYDVIIERDNGGTPSLQTSGVRADACSLYVAANVPTHVGSDVVDHPPEPTPAWDPPAELLRDDGVIRNPSFEFSTTDFRWDVTGPLQRTGTNRLEGTRAMVVYPDTVLSQTFFVDVGETYRLRCYVDGPGSLTMEISFQGDRVSKNAFGPVTPVGYGSWGYKDVVFVAPKIAMDALLYNHGDSECIVDFCTMFPYSGPITDPENEQLVQNPGFEEGTEPWLFFDYAEIRRSKVFTGVRGLRFRQEGSKAVQSVYLDGANVYRWHCYSLGNVHFALWKDSILYAENFGETFPVPNSQWTNQEVDVMIDESGEYELTFVRDNGGVPSRQRNGVWIDDCSLYAAEDGIPPYVGSETYNLPDISPWDPPAELLEPGQEIRNPSFEAWSNFRWIVSGDLKFTHVDPLIDIRSMFVYPNTVATQLVYLEQNERYRLICYVRGPGSLTMEVSHQGDRVSKNSFGAVTPIGRGGWGYKDVVFDATKISQDISLYNIGDSECVVDFCTLFPFSGPLTDPEYSSILADGSFEVDSGVWALSYGAETSTSESFDGTLALRFAEEGSKAVQIVSMSRDEVYRLHCYVQGNIRVSIWRDSTMYAENLGDTFDVANSDWENQEIDVEIPVSGDYQIVLERDDGGDPGGQSGGVWADACSLYLATDGIPPSVGSDTYNLPDISPWDPPAELLEPGQEIRNPSFEAWSNFRWIVIGDLKFTHVDPLIDIRSMFVYPNTVATQLVYLEQNERYRLRCYVRGPGSLTMEVSHQGDRVSKNSFGAVTPIGRGGWGYKDVVFDATKISQDISLYNIGDSECVVDFCTLFTFSGPLTDPEYSSILADGSFEVDSGVWALSDGAETSTSESFDGTLALRFAEEGSKAVQIVSMSRDEVYRLHCYVQGNIRVSIWRDSTMYAENLGDTFDVANSDWENQEIDVEIPVSGDYQIVLERDDGGDPGGQSGGVWADACSLYLATDGIPPSVGSDTYNLHDIAPWDPPAELLEPGQEIRNPSFEAWSNFHWTVSGDLEFSAVQPLHDERAMYVYPGETVARQTIWLDRGERYRMRCYIRGSGSLTMEVLHQGNRVSKNTFGAVTPTAYGDWGYKEIVFDATGITNEVLLYIVGNSQCLVDFCTLLPFSGALTDPELS